MSEPYSTKRMLGLRKLTRAVADLLRGQLLEYLGALAPLLRPKSVLGGFVDERKEPIRGADAAFRELVAIFEAVAAAKPFNLPKELQPPLPVAMSALELTPLEYSHTAKTDAQSKTVAVTSPLKWVLTYSGFTPRRLRDILAGRPASSEMQEFVVHTLMLHVVMTRQPGVAAILSALHFPVSSGRLPGFGELPITFISSVLTTVRPPDDVIMESTEVSGMDAFEEVVEVEDIARICDPVQQRLMELVRQHGEELSPPRG
jgi:hypothetical protein